MPHCATSPEVLLNATLPTPQKKSPLRKLYGQVRTAVLVFAGLFILAIPSLILLPFPFSAKVKFLHPCWRLFFKYVIKFVCRAKIVVQDLRTEEEKKAPWDGLYMANHQSLVDVPLFMSVITVPAIMKKELVKVPLFGVMAVEAGCIPVDRKNADSRRKAFLACCQRLKEGYAIHCYPEGTRSKTGSPKPFSEIHPALLYFAFDENIALTPIVMVGTEKFFSADGEIIPGQKVNIRVYPRLNPKDFSGHETFAQTAWQKIVDGHAELSLKN